METITKKDLFALLLAESGKSAKMIGLHTTTNIIPNKGSTVKSRVTSIPFIEQFGSSLILKWSEQTVQINTIYENSVNNRREKEGLEADFKAKELPFGEYVEGSRILIKHEKDGETVYYVRVYLTNSNLGTKVKFTNAQGKELSDKLVKIFKEEFMSIKKETVKSQGLDYKEASKPVTYSFDSIKQINMNGSEYRIVD